jgi:hypothetical protein
LLHTLLQHEMQPDEEVEKGVVFAVTPATNTMLLTCL